MKYTVFFVEDEITIREKIRESLDWESIGFKYLGDAPDGETALKQITQLKPDIVVTDIKMPHMDGLDLCRGIQYELPNTYIIILSGYNDFEFAQKAIHYNVSEYLLKPITPVKLIKALQKASQAIDQKREGESELIDLKNQIKDSYALRKERFLQELINGINPVDALVKADEFEMDLRSPFYAVMVFHSKKYMDIDELIETMQAYELDFPVFSIGFHEAGMIIMAQDELSMQALQTKIFDDITQSPIYSNNSITMESGKIVNRISELGESFQDACMNINEIQADVNISETVEAKSETTFKQMDFNIKVLEDYINTGLLSDLDSFIDTYFLSNDKQVSTPQFSQYLIFNLTFAVRKFAEKFNIAEETLPNFSSFVSNQHNNTDIKEIVKAILSEVIHVRENLTSRSESFLSEVLTIIENEFANEQISLSMLAQRVNVSPAYLSTVFKQEKDMTLSQYIIEKRIKKAKEYLKTTNMSISDISANVGYYNANYFSVLFKKHVGLTPREYRNEK